MEFTYKGLSAKLDRHIVTDEEMERQLQRLLQSSPRIAKVTDRPTEMGDEVVLDYAGFCNDEQFACGTAQNQTLTLGSGMFIPGFEEQLLDKVPGEEVIVKVTFPEAYHAENLAGKEAEFVCKLHYIQVKTPYEVDDTFAKEVGGCETLEDMRQKLKASLQAYADDQGEMELQDQLLRQAAETLELEITDEMLQESVDEQMNILQAQLGQQGLNLDMYCQFMGTTKEDLRKEAEPTARQALRNRAAIEKIVELEKLEATQEEIAQALAVVCRQNGMTMEQMKEYYDSELEKALTKSVLTGKVMSLIREAADIAE